MALVTMQLRAKAPRRSPEESYYARDVRDPARPHPVVRKVWQDWARESEADRRRIGLLPPLDTEEE